MVQSYHGPKDHCLNKIGKGPPGMQYYIPNITYLSKVVLEKKIFEYFFYVFLWFQPRTHVAGPS